MFGYIRPSMDALTEEEQRRYRGWYCGLCKALKEGYGLPGQMALTYDLTFLTMLLSSLYEFDTLEDNIRCPMHPAKRRDRLCNEASAYGADMTILLTYYKCEDDWQDDHKRGAKLYGKLLEKRMQEAARRHPVQAERIQTELKRLAAIEQAKDDHPDAAANCFGQLMAAIFAWKDDFWQESLAAFGFSLGKYIYLLDAVCDYDEDIKKGSFNLIVTMGIAPEDCGGMLRQTLGLASVAFERLPLVQDANILRNILYSGLWQGYNDTIEKRRPKGQA